MAPETDNGKLLARIDERTERIDQKIDRNHEDLCRRLEDHETRIRSLEGSQRWTVGRDLGAYVAAAVVAAKAFLSPQ